MAEILGRTLVDLPLAARWQRLYRKWDLDHHRRPRNDRANRSIAKRLGQRVRANYQQSQYDSVGSVFIELALVLPLLLMVIWGSIAVFQVIQVDLALNNAAIIGIQAAFNGASANSVQTSVDSALEQSGISPGLVTADLVTNPSEEILHLSTAVTVPIVGPVTINATQLDYAAS